MKFNLNDKVRVRLTDFGRKLLRDQHDELNRESPGMFGEFNPPKEIDGWSEWQAWNLFYTFGKYIHLGRATPFDLTIEIPDDLDTHGDAC